MNELCPCCSGKTYQNCCQAYHEGQLPSNAELLMRSRFSAYAKHLPHYIIQTTHPLNSSYKKDLISWAQEIMSFCQNTTFQRLEVIDFADSEQTATVTFIAYLEQKGKNASFKEKSFFEKKDNKWLYRSAIF